MDSTSAPFIDELKKANRGCCITIFNSTQHDLLYVSSKVIHDVTTQVSSGVWTPGTLPPEVIPPKAKIAFGTNSRSLMVGSGGEVVYRRRGYSGDIVFWWDWPFAKPSPHPASKSTVPDHSLTVEESVVPRQGYTLFLYTVTENGPPETPPAHMQLTL